MSYIMIKQLIKNFGYSWKALSKKEKALIIALTIPCIPATFIGGILLLIVAAFLLAYIIVK